jgi:hypothetical protein
VSTIVETSKLSKGESTGATDVEVVLLVVVAVVGAAPFLTAALGVALGVGLGVVSIASTGCEGSQYIVGGSVSTSCASQRQQEPAISTASEVGGYVRIRGKMFSRGRRCIWC